MINDILKALNGLGEVIQSLEKIKKELEEVAEKERNTVEKKVLATWIKNSTHHEIKIEKVTEDVGGEERRTFFYLYSYDELLTNRAISFNEAKDLAIRKGLASYSDNWSCSVP